MLLGVTETIQENNRVSVLKKIRIITILFIVSILLPFLIYLFFNLGLITGKPAFNSDIQEPVAKVVTSTGVGTAFLISPTILLTARHVVENNKVGDEVELFFEQSKSKLNVKAKIKYISPSSVQPINGQVPMDYFLTDIAVLEAAEITEIEPLQLGESDAVNNLDEVILIGYPNGDYSISKGNINSDKFQGFNLFKLDATSNPGNSGGPCILKNDNTVIGILVGGSGPQYQGENIALKIDDVKRILDNAKISY
ncbi:MAG: trypsin-like peptidase domain-containing protein [Sphingobacteriales bacterium]|nr:trypsin-like peptidase domain-containing protein [Sphingobacteriales bacterium]